MPTILYLCYLYSIASNSLIYIITKRYNPTREVLNLMSSKFNMDYIYMDGYTKLVYNFDEFLNKLSLWINQNNLTRADAATKLGISCGLFRFWFNGGVISISTYNNIKDNLNNYNLL